MKVSRVGVKPLKKLYGLKQKFEELPAVKFAYSLPAMVLNALEGFDDLEARLIGEIVRAIVGGGVPSSEDHRLAARVRKLQKRGVGNGITSGTIPELILYDWLETNGYDFLFQPQIDGGRARAGGVVPDFAVRQGGQWTVILVNGVYWHSRSAISNSDVTDKLTILGSTIGGMAVERVVTMWDSKIFKARPQVFQWGLAGIELGI